MTSNEDASPRGYSSPPCLASEIDPSYFDPLAVDPQQAFDVVRWRKAERVRLLAERMDLEIATRKAAADAIAVHLDALLSERFTSIKGLTISAWWPIKAELDLRAEHRLPFPWSFSDLPRWPFEPGPRKAAWSAAFGISPFRQKIQRLCQTSRFPRWSAGMKQVSGSVMAAGILTAHLPRSPLVHLRLA